jgi:hypothetical protein
VQQLLLTKKDLVKNKSNEATRTITTIS